MYSPEGVPASRGSPGAKVRARCNHCGLTTYSAHLDVRHQSGHTIVDAAGPAVQSGFMLPSAAPTNRCMPPEHVRACNAHESVPTAALVTGITVRAAPRSKQQHPGNNGIAWCKSYEVPDASHAISG